MNSFHGEDPFQTAVQSIMEVVIQMRFAPMILQQMPSSVLVRPVIQTLALVQRPSAKVILQI